MNKVTYEKLNLLNYLHAVLLVSRKKTLK